ncbi:glycosyltransferase family 39 protein, partial [Candidatus Omnitrophota bacterium]
MLLLLKKYKIEISLFLFSLAYFLLFSRYGIDIDDEGFHLHVSNMILKGLIPYRDFVIHASPGSFYLQAFIFKIFSPTLFVGRMSIVALGLYMTIVLYRISRYIIPSPNFAAISSILFIFWGVSQIRHPWYGWYGLALALSFAYLALKYIKTDKGIYLFLTGLFCGLTFFTKQNLGAACFVSCSFFLVIDTVFSKENIKEKISD